MTTLVSNNTPKFPQCRVTVNIEENHETAQLYPFNNKKHNKKYALEGSCEEIDQELATILKNIKDCSKDTSHRTTIKKISGEIEIQFVPNKKEIYSIENCYPDTTSWTQQENLLTRIQSLFSDTFAYMKESKINRIMNPLADRNNNHHKCDPYQAGGATFVSRKIDEKV